MTYLWHHVVLHGHCDDVEANDASDGQIKVLAADDSVDYKAWSGICGPIRRLSKFWMKPDKFLKTLIWNGSLLFEFLCVRMCD